MHSNTYHYYIPRSDADLIMATSVEWIKRSVVNHLDWLLLLRWWQLLLLWWWQLLLWWWQMLLWWWQMLLLRWWQLLLLLLWQLPKATDCYLLIKQTWSWSLLYCRQTKLL